MSKLSKPYAESLKERLSDPEYAAAYLDAALADADVRVFLLALRDVANAHDGISKVAADAGLQRESTYRILSEQGNPQLSSLHALLQTLGLRLSVQPKTVST